MTKILIAVLNMSIAASIVAVAVMLVRFPLKKAPKIFSYVLWAVVFLRLICPFSFESPASLMPINAEIIPTTITTAPMPQIKSGISAVDEPVNLFIESTIPQANPAVSVNPIQGALSISVCVWLCGSVALILYAIIGYIRVKRQVYDATLTHDNIFETDKIPTAFVLGLIRPQIYIPTAVKGIQLDYIIKHEQVHIWRRDYLIKPFAFLVLAIHWFNPIVWLCYFLMSKDMEMACDEAVLHKANDDIRQAYSVSMVNLYARNPSLLSPLAFGEGSMKNMKARIKNVLVFKKTPRWVIVLCSFLLVLFTAGFTTNPPRNLPVNNLVNIPAIYDEINADDHDVDVFTTINNSPMIDVNYSDYYNSKEYQQQWQSYDLSKEAEHRKTVYELYEPYGLVYDTTSNRLYHNGELVKYFEDQWGNPMYGGVFRTFGPFSDGAFVITAQRDTNGELVGLDVKKYDSVNEYEWEKSPSDVESLWIPEIAEKVSLEIRKALRDAYNEYSSYGLRYDVESGQLYHNNNLVRYFEDKAMGRYFGTYEEGKYTVYANRNESGELTGLNIINRNSN